MDLRIRSEQFTPSEDQSWLGSAHGTNEADTITLDGALLGDFEDGFVPSGIVLGRVTSTGLYGPYDPGAEDGRETARGHLFTTKGLNEGQTRVPAALLWHGQVIVDRLPENHGLDTDAADALRQIDYVGEVS